MGIALKELGKGVNRAWENVAEGWRELVGRSSSALTRFIPRRIDPAKGGSIATFPQWGMLAGEVLETGESIVVKVELPGISRTDCDVRVEDGALIIRGEKFADREHIGKCFYLMERAYGSFERTVALPASADPDSAKAWYRDGVLTVELAKKHAASRHRVRVQ